MLALLLYILTALLALSIARNIFSLSRGAAAVLLLLPLLPTGRALVNRRVYAPIDLAYTAAPLASLANRHGVVNVANPTLSDVYAQFLPWHAAVRYAIAHGEWPLWNPFALCGTILAGAVQSAPYHPLHILAQFLPLPDAVTYCAAMLYFLAALSAFLFTRDLVDSELAAIFGAVAWMLSSHIISFTGTALGMGVSGAPLVLLGARRIVHAPGVRSTSILGAALLLLVLSGHPETMLHVVALGVAYFVFEFFLLPARPVLPVIVSGLTAGIITLLLSSIFLLPFFEAVSQTAEFGYRVHGRVPQAARASVARVAHESLVALLPLIEGKPGAEVARHRENVRHSWAGSAYAGLLLLPLAFHALAYDRDRRKGFFGALFIWGVLAGANAPGVVDLLARLPLFSIAVNDRMIEFAPLAISVLAAMGVDRLQHEPPQWRSLAFLLAATSVAVVLVVVILHQELIASGLTLESVRTDAARAVLPLFLAAAGVTVIRNSRSAIIVLLVLLLVQRAGETSGTRPAVPRRAFYPRFEALSLIPRAGEPFRIVGEGDMLTPSIATHYRLEDVRGFEAMTFARLHRTYPLWCVERPVWSNRVDDLTAPFLSLMNVRYAFARPRLQPPPGWLRRGSFGSYELLENLHALPRAFVPRIVHTGLDERGTIEAMQRCDDFAREAWVDTPSQQTVENGTGMVSSHRRGTGLRLHASMQQAGWIVISESAWRGWRARERGRELPLTFGDHAFLAVSVPAGEHEIVVDYMPRWFVIGAWISGVSAGVLIMGLVLNVIRSVQSLAARPGSPARPSPSSCRPTPPFSRRDCGADRRGDRWASP